MRNNIIATCKFFHYRSVLLLRMRKPEVTRFSFRKERWYKLPERNHAGFIHLMITKILCRYIHSSVLWIQIFPDTAMNMIKCWKKQDAPSIHNPERRCGAAACFNGGYWDQCKAVGPYPFSCVIFLTIAISFLLSVCCVGMVKTTILSYFTQYCFAQCTKLSKKNIIELSDF